MVNALASSHSMEADSLISFSPRRGVHSRDVESSSAGEGRFFTPGSRGVGSHETSEDFFLDFLSTMQRPSEDGAEVHRGGEIWGGEQVNYQIKLTAGWLWWKVQKLSCFVSLGVGGLCVYGLGVLFFWGKVLVESNFILHPPTYVSTVVYFLVINRLVNYWFSIQNFLLSDTSDTVINILTLALFFSVETAFDVPFIYRVGHIFVYALFVVLGAKVLLELGRLFFTQQGLFIQKLLYFCQGFSYISVLVLSWPLLLKVMVVLFIFQVLAFSTTIILLNISLKKYWVHCLWFVYFFSSWLILGYKIFSVCVAVFLLLVITWRVFFAERPFLEDFDRAMRWMGVEMESLD